MTFAARLDLPIPRHCVAALFGLLAFAVRWWGLDSQALWLDEALTAHIAWAPDGLDFVHNTPPLYFLLARGWADLFGVDEVGLRSLSVVAGAAFVWAAPLVAREAFGGRAMVPTGILALLTPMHLYYSQEARAYALLMLELLMVFGLLWRIKRRWRRSTWVWLVLWGTAALYTHYLAAIPLAIAYAVIGPAQRIRGEGASTRTVAGAGLATVLLVAPWAVWWSTHTAFRPADMAWLAALWEGTSGPAAVLTSLAVFGVGAQEGLAPVALKQLTELPFPVPFTALVLVGIAVIALLALLRLRRESRLRRAAVLQTLALLVGPLLCLWAISLFKPVYCPARYDMIALPAFVLFVGYAAAVVGKSWLPFPLLVAIGIGAKDWSYLTAPALPDPSAAAAAHLAAEAAPDETVVLSGDTGLPVLARWYRVGWTWQNGRCRHAASGREFGCRLLPTSLETAPAAGMRFEEAVRDGSLATGLRELLDEAPANRGVFLVMSARFQATAGGADGMATQLVRAVLAAGYEFAGAEPELGVGHYVRTRWR